MADAVLVTATCLLANCYSYGISAMLFGYVLIVVASGCWPCSKPLLSARAGCLLASAVCDACAASCGSSRCFGCSA